MINPNFNSNNIVVFADGRKIGEAQSFSFNPEIEVEPPKIPIAVEGFSGTGCITKAGEELFRSMMAGSGVGFDIETRHIAYLPPRKLKTKKRRIVRKWKKKYSLDFETTLFKNCYIERWDY